MKKLLLLTAAGLIFQATPVLAGHHDGKMFEKHDTNGDGVISEAEFVAHAKAKFDEKDTNSDGKITKDEAEAAYKMKREKRKDMKEKWKAKRDKKVETQINNSNVVTEGQAIEKNPPVDSVVTEDQTTD